MKSIFPCLLFIFSFNIMTLSKTLIVPINYTSIQSAVDAAAKGDTVYVLNGTYNTSGVQYKSYISIIGEDNQKTILKGNGLGSAFAGGDAEEVFIENFKIINFGSAVYYYYNSGVFSANESIVVKNNVMENITDACIYFYWNSYSNKAVVDNNTFRNCGTAISMGRADNSVIISNNTIYGCNQGIELNTYSYPLVINNVIAYSKNIGISASGGKAKIINNTVVYNGGSGIYVTHEVMPIYNNIVCFNNGGIIDYYSGSVSDFNDVYGNKIDYGIPKGIHDISADPKFLDTLSFGLSFNSPCIDAGDPFSDYDMEPYYNGGRINIGAFGNTTKAAISNPVIDIVSDVYFDTLNIGETDTAIVWIHNIGSTRLFIESIHSLLPNQFSVINNSEAYVLPNDSLNVLIIFSPQVSGNYNSELFVTTNDKQETKTSIRLHSFVNFISKPFIININDIPNDQGGWVKVYFTKSIYDTDSLILGKTLSPQIYSIEIDDGSGWSAAASQLAYGKDGYSVLVHTTKDSSVNDMGNINFRVIAGMNEGNFVSNTMIGYSIDNLAPSIPNGFLANSIDSSGIKLVWFSNFEKDLNYYTIYRSEDGINFNKLINTIDTFYIDENTNLEQYYYGITATDINGNEGDVSEYIKVTITNSEYNTRYPFKYKLFQNYPNPFNPSTTISYQIPELSYVNLKIFNSLGQEIELLESTEKSVGQHSIKFNAGNLSSGIYFYKIYVQSKISGKHFIKIGKMILLK